MSRGVFEDNVLLDRLVQTFEKEYATDLGEGRFALQRLKEAAEKAKIQLSSTQSVTCFLLLKIREFLLF